MPWPVVALLLWLPLLATAMVAGFCPVVSAQPWFETVAGLIVLPLCGCVVWGIALVCWLMGKFG